MLKLSNFLKAGAVFWLFLSAASCGLWRSNQTGPESPAPTPQAASNIPFLTKDPEVFQARVLVEAFGADGVPTERRYFIARNGTQTLVRFDEGSKDERSYLRLANGEGFVLYVRDRTYAKALGAKAADEAVRNVTKGWLAATPGTRFERISAEGDVTKYLVEQEGVNGSETYVYYDEKLKYPVKQEMFSNRGGERRLVFRSTVVGFKPEAGDNLFKIPSDFREVR